jgi:hypothetical protein
LVGVVGLFSILHPVSPWQIRDFSQTETWVLSRVTTQIPKVQNNVVFTKNVPSMPQKIINITMLLLFVMVQRQECIWAQASLHFNLIKEDKKSLSQLESIHKKSPKFSFLRILPPF